MLTVDARCGCKQCEDRTQNIYRMIGRCSNCGTGDILVIYREGDESRPVDCPVCRNYRSVRTIRLATPDEFPEAEPTLSRGA